MSQRLLPSSNQRDGPEVAAPVEVHVGPEDMEPLVVEPEAPAVVQVSTVESEVAVLQEWSRGSAPGSVREDGSRCVIMEAAAEPEIFVGSSGGSRMPLWSASRLRSGCGQADKDPMSSTRACPPVKLLGNRFYWFGRQAAEQAPCLLTLEDITSLPPVHALSYDATAPVVVYIGCYRSVRDGCTSGRLEISVQVPWRIWATSLEDHSLFVSSRHVASTLSPCFCRNTLVKTHFAAPSLRPHC